MAGRHIRLVTPRGPVHVYTPPGATPSRATVIYLHGYGVTVDGVWTGHKLRTQFDASKIDATFIVPGTPSSPNEGVSWKSLKELLRVVSASVPLGAGPVAAVAHSGGYRTILEWLDEAVLVYIGLIDALYAGYDELLAWAWDPAHKLTLVGASPEPSANSAMLARAIGAATEGGVPEVLGPTLTAARSVYFAVANMTHVGLVTSGKVIPIVLQRVPTGRRSVLPIAFAFGLMVGAGIFGAVIGLIARRSG